jgi:hypothetical protein
MIYTSVDIGYHNLGIVQCDSECNVKFYKRIDITRYTHNCIDHDKCTLHHTNEVSDMIAHFVQEYQTILDNCDILLLERQPPGGLTSVESLLFFIFRHKVKLISPNSMHAHFGIGHLTYDERKERTVSMASKYMDLSELSRKHDIADAFCMILFEIQREQMKFPVSKNTIRLPFEDYRLTNAESLNIGL